MWLRYVTIICLLCISHSEVHSFCWCKPTTFGKTRISPDEDGTYIFKGGFSIPLVDDVEGWEVYIKFNSPVEKVEVTGRTEGNIDPWCDNEPCHEFRVEAKNSEEVIPRGESLEIKFEARGFREEDLDFKVTLDGNDCGCLQRRSQEEEDKSLSVGAIVGLALCVILLFVASALLIVCLVVVRKHFRDKNSSSKSGPDSNKYAANLSQGDPNRSTGYHGSDDQSVYQEIPPSEYAYAYADTTNLSSGHSFKHGSEDHLISNSEDGEGWVKNIVYVSSDDTGAGRRETERAEVTESVYDSAINVGSMNQAQLSAEGKTNECNEEIQCSKIIEYSTVIRNSENKHTSATIIESSKQGSQYYMTVLPNLPTEKEQNSATTTDKQDSCDLVDNIVYEVDRSDENLDASSCTPNTVDKNECNSAHLKDITLGRSDQDNIIPQTNQNTEILQNLVTNTETPQKEANVDIVVDNANQSQREIDLNSITPKTDDTKKEDIVPEFLDNPDEQSDQEYLTVYPNNDTEKEQNSATTTDTARGQTATDREKDPNSETTTDTMQSQVDHQNGDTDVTLCKQSTDDVNKDSKMTNLHSFQDEQSDQEYLTIWSDKSVANVQKPATSTDSPQKQENDSCEGNIKNDIIKSNGDPDGKSNEVDKNNLDASLNDVQDEQDGSEYLTLIPNQNIIKEPNSITSTDSDTPQKQTSQPDGSDDSHCKLGSDDNKQDGGTIDLHDNPDEQSDQEYLTVFPNNDTDMTEKEQNAVTTTDRIQCQLNHDLIDNVDQLHGDSDESLCEKNTNDDNKGKATGIDGILDKQSDQEYLTIWPNKIPEEEQNSTTPTNT